jgi:hypothetical protein
MPETVKANAQAIHGQIIKCAGSGDSAYSNLVRGLPSGGGTSDVLWRCLDTADDFRSKIARLPGSATPKANDTAENAAAQTSLSAVSPIYRSTSAATLSLALPTLDDALVLGFTAQSGWAKKWRGQSKAASQPPHSK